MWFACEKRILHGKCIKRFSKCGEIVLGDLIAIDDSQSRTQHIVEQNLVIRENRIAARHIRLVPIFCFIARDQCQIIPEKIFLSAAAHFVQPRITITPLSLFYKPPGGVIFIFRDFSAAFARHKLIGFYINGQELLFLGRFFKKRIYIFGILFKSCTIL